MSKLTHGPSCFSSGTDPDGPVYLVVDAPSQGVLAAATGCPVYEPGQMPLAAAAALIGSLAGNRPCILVSDSLTRASGEAARAALACKGHLFTFRNPDGTAADIFNLGNKELKGQLSEFLAALPSAISEQRYQLDPIGELLTRAVSPKWLVKNFFEKKAMAVLFGESRSLKSFVAIELGLCVASGFWWHGIDVAQGGVAYVAGEGSAGLGRRAAAWGQHNGVDLGKVPFCVLGEGVPMLDEKAVDHLIQAIEALPVPPALIILDTLSRCLNGDENSTQDMAEFVRAVDRLRNHFNSTVLVVHHSGLSDKGRARGSSVLFAAADSVFRTDRRVNTVTLSCLKQKDTEEPAPLTFAASSVLLPMKDEDGQALTSLVLTSSAPAAPTPKPLRGAARIAHEALVALTGGTGRVHIDAWRAESYRKGISDADTPEARKKAFQAARKALLNAGRIGVSDPFYWSLPGGKGDSPGELPAIPTEGSGRGVYKTPPSLPVATPGGKGEVRT